MFLCIKFTHKHCKLHSNSLAKHFKLTRLFQRLSNVSSLYLHMRNLDDISTYHWLRRLGIAWVLLWGSRGSGGVRGLGLRRGVGRGGAAV